MTTQPTIHYPRPAIVATEPQYRNQRRYGHDKPGGCRLRPSADSQLGAELIVYRDGTTDVAELQIEIGLFTCASMTVRMTPAEMRELAARLIDAAHDIEASPAQPLAQEAA